MHRMDLSSMVMLKDNHVWSQGKTTGNACAWKSRAVHPKPRTPHPTRPDPLRINYQGGEEGS